MLSRVAERLYWMARYLERAENTARLLNVYQTLLLDLPADARIGWDPILDILGCREVFYAQVQGHEESHIQNFVTANSLNAASLLSSLNAARENARTTRDLLPMEAWRAVNELHLFAEKELSRDAAQHRHDVLTQTIRSCLAISGLLAGTLSQGPAYHIICAGRSLERADMTTRLIDTASAILMSGREELSRYDNTLWMTILRSLSAYQMYRQHMRRRVLGEDVIAYLLKDTQFPRAVVHCLVETRRALETLPRAESAVTALENVTARLLNAELHNPDHGYIHNLIDELQLSFAAVHKEIHATWFLPEETAA